MSPRKNTKARIVKKSKFDFSSAASVTMTAALLLCIAIVNDSIFAGNHIAVYGPLPAVQSNDGYTPVKKSATKSKTETAAARATARSKASALKHGAASSYSPLYPSIDSSECKKDNPGGCTEMINAFYNLGNPACMLHTACVGIIFKASNTPECERNTSCRKTKKMLHWYFNEAADCLVEKPQLNCKTRTDAYIKSGMWNPY